MTGFVYELIYACVLSLIFMSAASPYLGMGATLPVLIASCAVTGGLVAFKKLGWSVRFIMIGVVITVTLAVFLLSRSSRIGEVIESHLFILWILVPAAGAFIAGELCARFRLIRVLTAASSIAACIVAVVWKYQPDKATVTGVLALVLIVLVEEIQYSWEKSGYTDHTGHLVYVAPFLMCAIILVSLVPAPDEAYDWAFVREIYRAAYETVQEISAKLDIKGAYDPAGTMIGFSGRGTIHDEVSGGSGDMLTLYDIPPGMSCVKLSGRTFDTFDGYEWTDSDTSEAPDVMLDTLSLLASVNDHSDEPQDYVRRSSIRIRYSGIYTSYVFLPLKALSGNKYTSGFGMRNLSGDLLWPEVQSYKTEYTVQFYRLNTGNELFDEYLRSSKMPSEENFDMEAHMFAAAGETPYDYKDLTEHVERIKSIYAQPVTLSDDMTDLMERVYDGAENDADKMSRLEAYLRTISYSDNPGPLPENMPDAGAFLDHFVLDTRAGYCSHFATAFVLLARAEGLPARYVQGYIVDTSHGSPIRVDSSMAHAWPEVYYEGAGWISYEPTPIYNVSSYWRSNEEIRAMYDEAAGVYPTGEDDEEEATADEPDEEEDTGISIPWYAIVIPVASGIVFTMLFIIAGNLIVTARFKHKDDEARMRILCRQNMNLLKLLECEMESGETLLEYRERLLEELGEEPLAFLPYYSEYLYRGTADTSAALYISAQSCTCLKAKLKKLYPLRYLRYYMGFQRA